MTPETNRLAQIIANAADKELGTRPDRKPKRQDKAAAEAIDAEYLFIRRSELPKVDIADRDGKPHVVVENADAGTWYATGNHENARRWGLEYLVAAEQMKHWQSKQEVIKRAQAKRRNEIREEILGGPTDCTTPALEIAIDRIIELEGAKG